MTTLLTKSLFSDLTRAVAVKACTRSQITSGLLMSEKTFSYLLDPLDRYLCMCFQVPGDSQDKTRNRRSRGLNSK